jgi:hypothetical protein
MIWLVVWNPNCYSLHHFYIFFQRGRAQPPTSDAFVGRLLACWWLNPDLDHGKYGKVMGHGVYPMKLPFEDSGFLKI